MIHIQTKRYQLIFWESEQRDGQQPALKLEFENLEEADATFAARKAERRYRSGVFIQWHRIASDWTLIERYPE